MPVSWQLVLPFVVLSAAAFGVAHLVRRLVGPERLPRATPVIRVVGIAVLVALASLRMWA